MTNRIFVSNLSDHNLLQLAFNVSRHGIYRTKISCWRLLTLFFHLVDDLYNDYIKNQKTSINIGFMKLRP